LRVSKNNEQTIKWVNMLYRQEAKY
jgi:hypothetical protein